MSHFGIFSLAAALVVATPGCSVLVDPPEVDGCPAGYLSDAQGECSPALLALTTDTGVLSPGFDPEGGAYTLQVPIFVERVTLDLPTPDAATVSINGEPLEGGPSWLSPDLVFGENEFVIEVIEEGLASTTVALTLNRSDTITFVKASNRGHLDQFGWSVAISADGNTMAVGAPIEKSNAVGFGRGQENDDAPGAGAVYLFSRSVPGGTWTQSTYVKASNTGAGDKFGASLALSDDGDILVVGAPLEDSDAVGLGGDQSSNLAADSGGAYIFRRTDTAWRQESYLKASNTGAGDNFGVSIALSGDGRTLAVGAQQEASDADGIDGNQTEHETQPIAGAVYVFAFAQSSWAQEAYVKASNSEGGDKFGNALALSEDGSTLAVGASSESGNSVGIDGNQENGSSLSGAAYVFAREGVTWSQQAYIKASNTEAATVEGPSGDEFGHSISLSADGNTLAVGARYEASNAIGVGGNQNDNSATQNGAVYVYERADSTWKQNAYIKATNAATDGAVKQFGSAVSLSGNGELLAIGAILDAGTNEAIGGTVIHENFPPKAAAYVYSKSSDNWSAQTYIKPLGSGSMFGHSLAVSADGSTLAIGAYQEPSKSTGIDGAVTQSQTSGAAFVYE